MRYHATRPPLRRMKVIDQALRAGRWPTDKSLAAELEADPRTIRRDLEFMRNQLQAPIKFSRARRGYYYSEKTYRLPFLQLSEGELISLFLAERMMQQFRGTPFEADLRRATKLGEMLPEYVADPLGPEPSVRAWRLAGIKGGVSQKPLFFGHTAVCRMASIGIKSVVTWPVLAEFWRNRDALGSWVALALGMQLALEQDDPIDSEDVAIFGPHAAMRAPGHFVDLIDEPGNVGDRPRDPSEAVRQDWRRGGRPPGIL
jgi:hypothetical protein